MSLPTTHSPQPQATEDALDFLLPGTPPDLPAPIAPERLDSFVSSQSLTDQAVLEGVGPFDGVHDIEGLFFIKLDGRVFEVQFDPDKFRYNIVSPHSIEQHNGTSQSGEHASRPVLSDWHPQYQADSKEWVLLPASQHSDADASEADRTRFTILPYRVDGLLRREDLDTVVSTVERFLLRRVIAQSEAVAPARTLLSLLASPHLTALAVSPGNAGPSRKTLDDTLDAMLTSTIADQLAEELLWALEWYGGEDGEITDPAIRQQLVWAALMLELDPPGRQQEGHVADCDLQGPDNWGLTYPQRRARLMAAVSSKTDIPEMALHILGPAIPDFMVHDVDEDMQYGSAPWVNFAHGVALANTLQPGSLMTLTFDELIELPLKLGKRAADDELKLIAAMRALPCVIWARAHGILQPAAGSSGSPTELQIATRALDNHLTQATKAVEDVTREAPDRSKIAYKKLQALFGVNYAQFLQYKDMHGASLWKQIYITLKNPSPQKSVGPFLLIDVFSAGKMINGMDEYQPFASLHEQEEANQKFSIIANMLRGIDIPAMFEAAFDTYEAKAKSGYAFLIENLLSRLPRSDRKALQNGRVSIHTLRIWTGKLAGSEKEQHRVQKRGRFGFIIECQHLGDTFFYEMFPILGLFVRHAKLAIPTTRPAEYPSILPSALKITAGTQVAIDWSAYQTLAVPRPAQSSLVISEKILDFASPGAPGEAEPVLLTSIRLKHIAFAVANEHVFFNPQDSRERHRQRTYSEVIEATYPLVLRALEPLVPGLACTNAIMTNETPLAICALEGVPLIGPAFKFLRGAVQITIKTGQLAILGALPKFGALTNSALLYGRVRYGPTLLVSALPAFGSGLITRTLGAGAIGVQALHTLATRMKRYVNSVAGRASGYNLIASIPSVSAPGAWRPLGAFDALGQVNGLTHVPFRTIPRQSSGTGSAHYLITPGTGLPFGPRLVQKSSFTPPRRINGQPGYALSGRGAMASPITSSNSGKMGEAIEATADVGAVLEKHGIAADAGQLETIEMWLKEGAPVFLYETSTGRKSLVLHVVDEKIFQDLFTDAKVYFSRHYNHQTLGTWKVPPAIEEQIRQVKLDELLAGRSHLSSDRLSNVREAIMEGQHLPPIKVRPPSHGLYSVVDGNHRLEVARNLGLETVPVQIVDA
ncbi:ParB/RepB/Spo0J family partition protein [Xanthomonas sp. WHRI 1810A]|uniref:ParB/RepB/Spo0J family partition protein n=1 Tax=Xanthomonas sp. WHRI 1810A TaxID=3161565 RepID=UPI0032E898E5